MSSDYCVDGDMDIAYGANNITKWCDLDLDADVTKIANRKAWAIDKASDDIDDVFRTLGYRIPLKTAAAATPGSIKSLCAIMAGLCLYEGRGAIDMDRNGSPAHGHAWRREETRRQLEAYQAGNIKPDAELGN